MNASATHIDGQDLLLHIPEYGVIICRQCKYAVQPQALASHLLGHHIYRSDRQKLLSRLEKLILLEPEEVTVPPVDISPFPDLPLHNGLACSHSACSHLCISRKRMEQHWSKEHGERNSHRVLARPAMLQTFFRGNKIRYFEVQDCGSNEHGAMQGLTTSEGDNASPKCSISPTADTEGESHAFELDTAVNLQHLRYFHHYRHAPCPVPHESSNESTRFWEVDLYELAFTHDFLMYIILGYSATDMAMRATVVKERQQHLAAAMDYESTGMSIFRRVVQRPDEKNSLALLAGARFVGVKQLMLQLLEETHASQRTSDMGPADKDKLELDNVIEAFCLFRGTEQLILGMQHLLPSGSEFLLHAKQPASCYISTENISPIDMPSNFLGPPGILGQLKLLPTSLSDAGLINNDVELAAMEQASVALIIAISRSFAAHEPEKNIGALWDAVATYTQSLPDHFITMLKSNHPAALILYAYGSPLLLPLEDSHFFLRGHTTHELSVIRQNLLPEHAVFIAGLEPLVLCYQQN